MIALLALITVIFILAWAIGLIPFWLLLALPGFP
ncbi:hypothetical protein PRJ_Fausto_00134 [Faustovirus]|nr:hypothetical protein PRJ_Fausto_00134 [Faustovirus]